MQSKKRFAIVDLIKAFAIICVIMNHSEMFDKNRNAFFLLVIDKAVPIFLILSGFIFAFQYLQNNSAKLYEGKAILKRFIRLTIPMIVAFLFYVAFLFADGQNISLIGLVKSLVLGYYGQGSYYYGLMVQFLIIAPILLLIIRKYKGKGLLIIIVCNLVFEILCNFMHLPDNCYRVLVFRYLTAIGCGMYLYGNLKVWKNNPIILNKIIMACVWVVGLVYVIAPAFGYEYRFFTYKPWGRTSMISIMYVFPIIYLVIKKNIDNGQIGNNCICKFFEEIGKASYHIMYTQMIYYLYRPMFDKNVFDISKLGKIIEMAINIIVSMALGLLFYKLEKMVIKIKNSNQHIEKRF